MVDDPVLDLVETVVEGLELVEVTDDTSEIFFSMVTRNVFWNLPGVVEAATVEEDDFDDDSVVLLVEEYCWDDVPMVEVSWASVVDDAGENTVSDEDVWDMVEDLGTPELDVSDVDELKLVLVDPSVTKNL